MLLTSTYDGQVVSNLSEDLQRKQPTYLSYSHKHSDWIEGFRFLKILGLRSLKDDETAIEWLNNMSLNKDVTFSVKVIDRDHLDFLASWDGGRELYHLRIGETSGIEAYELSYGSPPDVQVVMKVLQFDVIDGIIAPKSIDISAMVDHTTEHSVVTFSEVGKISTDDVSKFKADDPVEGYAVVDIEKQEAYKIQNGKKEWLPFFDPVSGETTTGPRK